MGATATRVRRSLTDLQADYDRGDTAELEALVRAWKGMKERPPTDPQSFFVLGGFHGEPFRGEGATNSAWWGGYCQHGTVLFPTWHRAYLFTVEKALQSVPGCQDVMLPFWDETSPASRTAGIPSALTDETFVLDGETIPNPLRSFVFPASIVDDTQDDSLYSKAAGYETVRYPLSGLVGTPESQQETAAHNALFPNPAKNVGMLNGNVVNWLNVSLDFGDGRPQGNVADKFIKCLDAPNYTLFSNTTSMGAWNNAHPTDLIVALESPHNSIHLAVGGFDLPNVEDRSAVPGANGDMGENDTAGLDPIFYFHHCFIDYVFWTWQQRNGATTAFTIDPADPGAVYVTSANAGNQPPAGADPDAPISMDTPLEPFAKDTGALFTAQDCVDIEAQLGYTYGPGSLDEYAHRRPISVADSTGDVQTLHVGALDRAKIRGSFVIAVYAEIAGRKEMVGHEAVLSRWNIEGCANCQQHLRVATDFRVPGDKVSSGQLRVEVRTHDGLFGASAVAVDEVTAAAAGDRSSDASPFTVELRRSAVPA